MRYPCSICGSYSHRILYTLHSSTFGSLERPFYLAECKKCSFMYIKNPPTQKELKEMYSSVYFNSIDKIFNIKHFTYTVPRSRKKRYNALLAHVEKYVSQDAILDIGTGLGAFLSIAKSRGWNVYGIEPSMPFAKYCKEKMHFDIQQCGIEEASYPSHFFSVINMDNVLEHLLYLRRALVRMRSWLKVGGVLVVEVPNERGLLYSSVRLYKIIREKLGLKNHERILHHISYFDRRSLTSLLSKAGYEILECSTRPSYPTLHLPLHLALMQRFLLTISRFSGKYGDILTVIARTHL